MALSRAKFIQSIQPDLAKLFSLLPSNYTVYRMKSSYGKYSIYRWDVKDYERTSTTLAKGLKKEEATGMMKLLKESK